MNDLNDLIYLCFINDENEETIHELSSEFLDEANQIPYFKSVYGTINFEGHLIGTLKHPIKFMFINPVEFIIILNMLKLKKDLNNMSFMNSHITYHVLINYDWQYLCLPKDYLIAIQDMSIESIIKCMCVCSQLSLWELRQLYIYRIIYLLHNHKTISSTMESMVKHASHYDILIFQKQCTKLINADSKYQAPSPVRESRSKSF